MLSSVGFLNLTDHTLDGATLPSESIELNTTEFGGEVLINKGGML